MYPECFTGIGKFKDFEYHINVDKNVKLVVHAHQKIALPLQGKLEKELEEMVRQDIIAPVEGHSDWVNSLVIREKPNGHLRICLDLKDLNKAIKQEHHPIPTLDDITSRLHESTLFSKLDAKQGYWNVKLNEESTLLTTFNTHKGRYNFLHMPFGLKMLQDIFQKKIDQTYEKCKGAVGIADDMQVFGSDQTHDLHLHEAMERTRKAGIKLNYDKCIVKTRSCSFFSGNIYTPEGIKPDPSKIDAIKRMEAQSTKQELQSFLGMVNYLSSYIHHMSHLTSNLRNLLKKDSLFQWTETHQADFQMLKKAINKDVNLQYFDPKKQVVLQVDASQVGLGAAVLQDSKVIAYASKSLTLQRPDMLTLSMKCWL